MKTKTKILIPWPSALRKTILLLTMFLGVAFAWQAEAQTPGESCDAPLVVNVMPFTDSGNTSAYGNNYGSSDVPPEAPGAIMDGTGVGNFLNGDEVVYSYTAGADGSITINTTNDDEWVGLWVFTHCPFASTVGYHTESDGDSRSIPDLPVIEGETYYIVISVWPAPDSIDFTISITGTDVGNPQTCIRPTSLTLNSTSVNEAEISWTAGEDETEWEVIYGEAGFAPESEGESEMVNDDPNVTLTDLTDDTDYEVYVKAICDANDESWLTGPLGFTTLFVPVGDCINTSQFPNDPVTPNDDGSFTSINGCSYFGEYSVITGVISGEEYMFAGEENSSGNLAYITVRSGSADGSVVDTGTSPLTITASDDADFYVHWNADEDCDQGSECATTSVTCITCAPVFDCPDIEANIGDDCEDADGNPGEINEDCECEVEPVEDLGCVNTSQWPTYMTTPNADGSFTSINSCNYFGDYSVVTGIVSGEEYMFNGQENSSENLAYITVRSGSVDGPVVDTGISPLTITASDDADLYVHWNADEDCDQGSECATTSVTCVTCALPVDCENPEVSVSVVDEDGDSMDCVEENGQYYVSIALTGGSGNESYTVYDAAGDVIEANLAAEGTYQAGPYDAGDAISFTVEGNDDDECSVDTEMVDPDICDVEPEPEYYISSVETTGGVQDINNPTGNDGYTDYTGDESKVLIMVEGQSIMVNITGETNEEEVNFGAWLDLDLSGTFGTAPMGDDNSPVSGYEQILTIDDFSGEVVSLNAGGPALTAGSEFVLRLQVKKSALSPNDLNFTDGETEDYLVRVLPVGDCDDPFNSDAATSDVYISSIQIAGIGLDVGNTDYDLLYTSNNMSTDGYDVVSNPTLTIYPGLESAYTVSSGPVGNANQYYYSVWIDLNQDGCFDADEQFIWSNDVIWGGGIPNGEPGVEDVPFTFGQFAPGTYQARIRNSMVGHPSAEGAGDGEALDFTIEVLTQADAGLVLGVDNHMFTDFTYYPNPVENQLSLHAGTPIEQVEVYNLLGQKVIQVQPNALETNLDTDRLQSGVYLMNVTIDGSQKTFRIVKK